MGDSEHPERAQDNSLRNFFVPLLVVSVILIAIMAVIEQTAG